MFDDIEEKVSKATSWVIMVAFCFGAWWVCYSAVTELVMPALRSLACR